jgi:adenosylcobyric acid synthase
VAEALDVAAVTFPRISNFTDLDALAIEPGVTVRMVDEAAAMGSPDLVVLPGTKATVADLEWLRGRGLDRALAAARHGGATVLGICGGYQMLGRSIVDHVESGRGAVAGLGWLPVDTTFEAEKITRQRVGRAFGHRLSGYEIHHGVTTRQPSAVGWVELDDRYGASTEGAKFGAVFGTALHGVLESDGLRAALLTEVAARRAKRWVPAGVQFAAAREAQFDRLADVLEAHLDLVALDKLIAEGAPA